MGKLPGDYVAGFVDGEGCFALKFRRDVKHERKNSPVYFYWDIEFAIVLRQDDQEILEFIKETLKCGYVTNNNGQVRYSVNDLNDLLYKIVPFFNGHALRAKKQHDFELWKEALLLLHKNKGLATNIRSTNNSRGKRTVFWKPQDLAKLVDIHNRMAQYKAKRSRDWKWLHVI